jgi:uncharacterized protein YjdB
MSQVTTFIRSTATFLLIAAATLLAAACADGTEPVSVASVQVTPAVRTLNDGVARVATSGRVTAVAAGTAAIRATVGGIVGSAQITVIRQSVDRVQVDPTAVSLIEGETRALVALAFSAGGDVLPGRNVTWSSQNSATAEVDGTGRVVGKAAGTTVISATVEDRSAAVSVTVSRVPVASIAVTPTGVDPNWGGGYDPEWIRR